VDKLSADNLSADEPFAEVPASGAGSIPEAGLPDWLTEFQSHDSQSQAQETPAAEDGEALPDWLKAEPSAAPSAASKEAPPSSLPDWLTGLRGSTEAGPTLDERAEENEPFETSTLDDSQAELPDWLSGVSQESGALEEAGPTREEPGELSGDDPDWLLRVRARHQEEFPPEPAYVPDETGANLDPSIWASEPEKEKLTWLEASASGAQAQPEEELPDWLTGLAVASQARAGADDLPAWLAGQAQESSALPESQAFLEEPKAEGFVPQAEPVIGETQEIPSGEYPASDVDDDLSNWLTSSAAAIGVAGAAGPTEAEPDEIPLDEFSTDALPDWLNQGQAHPAPDALESAALISAQEKPGETGWMAGLAAAGSAGLAASILTDSSATNPEEDQLDFLKAMEQPAETDLDWLADLKDNEISGAATVAGVGLSAGPVGPFAAGEDSQTEIDSTFSADLPAWLASAAALAHKAGEKGMEIPPAEAELPKVSPFASIEEVDIGQGQPGLAPAELPNWLEAMRPTDADTSGVAALTAAEVAGPLAGLRNLLPAEADIARLQKPPAYAIKLQVTESQQQQADLFSQLIQAEGVARPLPKRAIFTSQHLFRIGIGIILVAVVAWSIFAGNMQLSLPAHTPETEAVARLVGGLSTGMPVLLAIDYEPGLSGEMDATTGAVLDDLMLKGAYIAIVSTTPTGPLQAERLVGQVNLNAGHNYTAPQQYTNLGFIPGGISGLASFAETPIQAAPVSIHGGSPWQETALATVQSLENFRLVLVATESPENARAWIEQVQPRLGNTPLVMIISAQAEPVVRPYYQAIPQQIQGLVTGLAGGAAYENLTGRSGSARAYWTPFSLGVLAALGLVIAGALVNSLATAMAARRENREGEGRA
jgi:hypothetical protein